MTRAADLTRRVTLGVIGAGLCAGCFVLAGADAFGSTEVASGLSERTECAPVPPDDGGDEAAEGVEASERNRSGDQTLTVSVPATAMLLLGADGEVDAAWTNTGCAPRTSDDIFVTWSDGVIQRGSPDLVERVWTGDFRDAGVPVPQR